MRASSFLAVLVVLGIPWSPLVAATGQEGVGAGTSRIARVAEDLLDDPNSARLHLEMGKAYFTRGAVDDAGRVLRHFRRAIRLDSSLEAEANAFVKKVRAGLRNTGLSREEGTLDERIAETLLGGLTEGRDREGSEEPRDMAAMKEVLVGPGVTDYLEMRMAGRDYGAMSFEGIRNDLKKVFAYDGAQRDTQMDWEGRLVRLRENAGTNKEWERLIDSFVSRNLASPGPDQRQLDEVRERLNAEDPDYDPKRDAFVLKREAVLAFQEGEVKEAVEKLFDIAAAVDEKKVAAAAAAGGSNQVALEYVGDPTPVLSASDLSPQASGASTSGSGSFESVAQAAVEQASGKQDERIGEKALEVLEAMGNENVPIETAGVQMMEMVLIGEMTTPLLIDLNGNGRPDVRTTLLADGFFDASRAVRFDLDGDGHVERTEWILPNADGLLFVDLDGDGVVSSGRELFGTAHGDPDGWARLAVFDVDGNGWVEGREAAGLAVWIDDGDGVCRRDEVRDLSSLGIEAVSCRPVENAAEVRTRGRTIRCWDWWPDLRF